MGAAFTIVGGLLSAGSSIMGGIAQSRAYSAQAQMAEQNARMAELQGEESVRKGARDEAKLRARGAQFLGTQRAMMGASGLTTGGSNQNILMDTGMGIEQDADNLRFQTAQTAYGFDVERINNLNQASVARSSASNAKTAGYIGAFNSLLGMGGRLWAGRPVGEPTGASLQNNTLVLGSGGAMAGAEAGAGIDGIENYNPYGDPDYLMRY